MSDEQKDLNKEIPDASQTTRSNPYYKPTTNPWAFRLINEEYEENYSVWDNKEKVYLRDEVVDAAERTQKVKATQYMKSADFLLAFPHHAKNTRYDREIVVDGVIYKHGFKYTQHAQLLSQIETIKGVGKTVEEMVFSVTKQTKSGSELTINTPFNDIEYKVSAKLFISDEAEVVSTVTSVDPVEDSETSTENAFPSEGEDDDMVDVGRK